MNGPSFLRIPLWTAVLLLAGGTISGSSSGIARADGGLFGPKGAPWTIQCMERQGPERMKYLEQIAETLRQTSGIREKDVYVMDHHDGFARLYYGTYHRRTDRKTGKRDTPRKLKKDLELIKQLGTGPGEYYFARALAVRKPMPDVGNPAWALSNAKGTYTFQVAAFEPTDEFWEHKQAAADACERLREKGYEAYYHHGTACSMVTVGTFGPDAVQTRRVTENDYATVRNYYSPEVEALLQDENLRYHHVNGAIIRVKTESGESVPVHSRLVEMPQAQETIEW